MMKYQELLPDDMFSKHVECFWQVSSDKSLSCNELFLPTCTLNIVFVDTPCIVQSSADSKRIHLKSGVYVLGQTQSYITFNCDRAFKLRGIRLKPFALANIVSFSIKDLSESFTDIRLIFPVSSDLQSLSQQVLSKADLNEAASLLNEYSFQLFKKSMTIDELIRAQTNYILERHGDLKLYDLTAEFKTSKVTLNKHFVKKIGLTPKKICQIWRMNKALQLIEENENLPLGHIGAMSGFYDQAHFIKDFKSIFNLPPQSFFKEKTNLINLHRNNIINRFNHQYDPKVV